MPIFMPFIPAMFGFMPFMPCIPKPPNIPWEKSIGFMPMFEAALVLVVVVRSSSHRCFRLPIMFGNPFQPEFCICICINGLNMLPEKSMPKPFWPVPGLKPLPNMFALFWPFDDAQSMELLCVCPLLKFFLRYCWLFKP